MDTLLESTSCSILQPEKAIKIIEVSKLKLTFFICCSSQIVEYIILCNTIAFLMEGEIAAWKP